MSKTGLLDELGPFQAIRNCPFLTLAYAFVPLTSFTTQQAPRWSSIRLLHPTLYSCWYWVLHDKPGAAGPSEVHILRKAQLTVYSIPQHAGKKHQQVWTSLHLTGTICPIEMHTIVLRSTTSTTLSNPFACSALTRNTHHLVQTCFHGLLFVRALVPGQFPPTENGNFEAMMSPVSSIIHMIVTGPVRILAVFAHSITQDFEWWRHQSIVNIFMFNCPNYNCALVQLAMRSSWSPFLVRLFQRGTVEQQDLWVSTSVAKWVHFNCELIWLFQPHDRYFE